MTPTPEVISLGNMLVEIMRTDIDVPLDRAGTFAGPFPSGDTPIFVDTVARLGRTTGFIGVVGDDDFGRCLLDRFVQDGVDTSHVVVLPDYSTGVAFVAYFRDGSRRFLFHWRHAAAGQLGPEHVQPDYVRGARWLHVTGCNLAVNESCRMACERAVELLGPGARLSFDPNIRPEVLSVEEVQQLCRPILERCDVFFPSRGEAMMLTGATDDDIGCRQLAAQGKLVVLKRGAEGCRVYVGTEVHNVPGFVVPEVDPTGAGDTFCAAFVVGLLDGLELAAAAQFANAAGALAVTRRGPMEGAPTREEVTRLLHTSPRD